MDKKYDISKELEEVAATDAPNEELEGYVPPSRKAWTIQESLRLSRHCIQTNLYSVRINGIAGTVRNGKPTNAIWNM